MNEDWDALWDVWRSSAPALTNEQRRLVGSATTPESPLADDAARYIAPEDPRPLARVLEFRPRRRDG